MHNNLIHLHKANFHFILHFNILQMWLTNNICYEQVKQNMLEKQMSVILTMLIIK